MTEEWTGRWQDGKTFDLFREMRALCYSIDWKAMTGEDLRKNRPLLEALECGADTLPWLILPLGLTRWGLPLPATNRAKRSQSLLGPHITKLIAERRKNPSINDLLGKMVSARDRQGSTTTDDQLYSTVTMYFGADQLHVLYAWTFYLLSQNPKVEAKMHEEVDRVLKGTPTADDVGKLPYTTNVLKESMRVMPPVWGFFRELTADYRLGDVTLPQGSLMGFSPWVTHRDPRYWPDPLRFDPDRWLPEAKKPPAISYFPFSAGPYWCHGGNLAMIEAVLMTAIIARRWSMRAASSRAPKPIATWCTEPKGGLHMTPTARKH
jgi:cytochrome P450